MKRHPALPAVAALFLAVAPAAFAHPGHDGDHDFGWDFSHGFTHPLTGADHLLAMLAVGIWAVQLGGRARWLMPLAFVATMTLAAVLGRMGMSFPGLEQGIAASVLVLGLLVGTATKMPISAGMGLVGLFAIFHGYAHGAEMPVTAEAAGYGIGFVLATLVLHAAGIAAGLLAQAESKKLTRAAGWAIAACGAVLFAV